MAKINISFNNVTYSIDESAIASAISELETALSNLNNPDDAVNVVIILDETNLDYSILD